jgi:Pyruvate/2-oxoacid:ferredoxin oxidoreductase gamma subunit
VLGIRRTGEDSGELPRGGRNGSKDLTLKVAGFGGQGVLLLGQMLAEIGMREGMEVSWLPSYGPEMRSGSAHCHVCYCGERIGSPLISSPDVLIAMNEISLRKFAAHVKPDGVILYNGESLPEGFEAPAAPVICVPASTIADQLGTAKAANVVLLGALQAEKGVFGIDVALKVIETAVKNAAMLEVNRKAIEAGRVFVAKAVAAA